MGYELYRLLSTATPSMSSSKSMPSKKKKSPTPDKVNGEPEVIDLDEEEKHMELLIGQCFTDEMFMGEGIDFVGPYLPYRLEQFK